MFEKSNEIAVLKTRIKQLEQRKQRLLAACNDEGNTHDSHYWVQSDLERIDCQIQDANLELARKTGAELSG
jgi:hypothetical protein